MAYFRANTGGSGGGGTLQTLIIDYNGNRFSGRNQYSVNVASFLPDDYQNLTLDNFSVSPDFTYQANTNNPGTSDLTLFLAYNSSTGILSVGRRATRAQVGTTQTYLNINYYIKVTYYT